MQILTIQKGFESFKWKFETNSKHWFTNSKGIRSIQMEIQTLRTRFEAFECIFKVLTIRMQIQTIRKGFEPFQCKFYPFQRDSKHSNANSKYLNKIRIIQMQIWTIWTEIWTIGLQILHSKIVRFESDLVRFRYRSVYIPIQVRSNKMQHNFLAIVWFKK